MRDDLDKLLCERERPRSWDHYSNYRDLKRFESLYEDAFVDDRDDEDDELFTGTSNGYRESMKFRYGWDKKSFGENLNPLYGLIRKSVGRRWDKVYSDLCKVFDPRSVTGNHILQHVFDRLADPKDTFVGEDGKVWYRGRWSSRPERIKDSSFEFFVDPRDGILKRNHGHKTYRQVARQRAVERAREEAKVKRVIDQTLELHFIDGVWFEVRFQTFDGNRKQVKVTNSYSKSTYYRTDIGYPLVYDVLKKMTVQANRVAVSKRTISHKELKKYGLVM